MILEMMISDPMLDVWRLLGSLLGTLLIVTATLWASQQLLGQVRALWRVVRDYKEDIVAAVDEPTDPFIRQLAQLSSVPDVVWAAFLSAFLNSLAAGLDQALAESPEENQTD
jgi:hypothetical protein